MANKPLRTTVRPASLDVRGQQPSLFPFDAFEFNDPNRVDEPVLTMKPPWKLVASEITVEALQAAFVRATEIIVGYLGADPDNPVDGDRRLVIKAFLLVLEQYNNGWSEDISLGGFDAQGKFIDYMVSAGITQNKENISIVRPSFGLPAPASNDDGDQLTYTHFANFNAISVAGEDSDKGTVVLGSYAGEDVLDGSTGSKWGDPPLTNFSEWFTNAGGVSASAYAKRVSYSGGNLNIQLGYTDDATIWSTDPYIGRIDLNVRYLDSSEVFIDEGFTYVFIYYDKTTREIKLRRNVANGTDTNDTLNTGIFLEPGINNITLSVLNSIMPYDSGGLIYFRRPKLSIEHLLLTVVKPDGGVENYENAVPYSGSFASDLSTGIAYLRNSIFSNVTSLTSITSSLWPATTGGLNYVYPTSTPIGTTPWVYPTWSELQDQGYLFSDDYLALIKANNDYYSLVDKDRDVALIPSSVHGKVSILNGGVLPSEYSDKYITVSGPYGPKGPAGPQGPVGYSNVDGGSASSLYAPDQIIDGGNA